MDFHSLARKELQALCKKNKIPANMTNVAMADALQALQNVEGLEEFLNPSDSNLSQSPEKNVNGSPAIPRTAARASTRRKPTKQVTESTQPLTRTRRGTRGSAAQGIDQENKDVNVLITPAPAVPGSRRRVPAASSCRKIETQLREAEEDEKSEAQERSDVVETPLVPSTRRRAPATSALRKLETENSVQRVYSTRHSVRLLEKNLGEMSLVENGKSEPVKIDDISEEMTNSSEISEISVQFEKEMSEANTQTVSEVGPEETNDSEVLSDPKPVESMEMERELKVDNKDMNKSDDESREDNLKSEMADNSGVKVSETIDEVGDEDAQTVSEVGPEETNDSEVLSDPKPVESMEMERELKVDIKDMNKSDDESKEDNLKSEMADNSGVKVSETIDEAGDEGSDESDIISSEKLEMAIDVDHETVDEKVTEQDTRSEDSLVVKESNDASAEDMDHVSESLSPQYECQTLASKDSELNVTEDDDHSYCDSESESTTEGESDSESESLVVKESNDASAEDMDHVSESLSPQYECQTLASKDSELNVTEDDDHSYCDSESESTTEGESDEEIASDENSSECEENCSDDDAETEEEKDLEAPVLPIGFEKLENNHSGSESIVAEQSDIQVSVENQASTMEIYNTEALVDVYVTEAEEVAMKTNDQSSVESPISMKNMSPDLLISDCEGTLSTVATNSISEDKTCHAEDPRARAEEMHETLVDVCVMPAHESNMSTDLISDGKVTYEIPFQPFAADQLSGQFPRPTQLTPRKSSAIKESTIQKVTDVSDDDEENIDTGNVKVELDKEKAKPDELAGKSLRQLAKMLKEMHIKSNKKHNTDKSATKGHVGKKRIALQALPENCSMAVDEGLKEN